MLRDLRARPRRSTSHREIAAIMHDLRGPLTRIQAAVELLQEEVEELATEEIERIQAWLAVINRAAATLTQQVDRLMDASPSDQFATFECSPTDLVALVQEIAADYQATAVHHQFHVLCPSDPLVGMWDGALLARALDNLLDNAVKYSPLDSKITITLGLDETVAGDQAVLTIEDAGVGIPHADLPYVFGLLHRGSNVTHQHLGNGIGLANVRQIVQQHRGDLSLCSEEGIGTSVTMRLPLVAPSSEGGFPREVVGPTLPVSKEPASSTSATSPSSPGI